MRTIGIKNTAGQAVNWSVGTGEHTGLQTNSAHAVFFGSSFNVVDQGLTLLEVSRVLKSRGWFGCMWNHRDLNDPIQQQIESIIKSSIPGYSYGSRREDPTSVIAASKLFTATKIIEGSFKWQMPKEDIIVAWRSHATLKRQADTTRRSPRSSIASPSIWISSKAHRCPIYDANLLRSKISLISKPIAHVVIKI